MQHETRKSLTTKKQSLLEKLIEKVKHNIASDDGEAPHPNKLMRNNSYKDYKQIKIGWLYGPTTNQSYKQIRDCAGGGTRRLKVAKSLTKDMILKTATDLFFLNRKSEKGNLHDFIVDLFDYQRHAFDSDITIQEIMEKTGFSKLRFYLTTMEKKTCDHQHND